MFDSAGNARRVTTALGTSVTFLYACGLCGIKTRSTPLWYGDCSQAGAVCCPVMIFVGEQDRRVPLQQGVQYYHALKAAENLVDEEIRLNVRFGDCAFVC